MLTLVQLRRICDVAQAAWDHETELREQSADQLGLKRGMRALTNPWRLRYRARTA